MRFKKISIDVLDKTDDELDTIIANLKWRPFAHDMSEFNEHIFLPQSAFQSTKTNREIIHMAMIYMRPEYRKKLGFPHELKYCLCYP